MLGGLAPILPLDRRCSTVHACPCCQLILHLGRGGGYIVWLPSRGAEYFISCELQAFGLHFRGAL